MADGPYGNLQSDLETSLCASSANSERITHDLGPLSKRVAQVKTTTGRRPADRVAFTRSRIDVSTSFEFIRPEFKGEEQSTRSRGH